ncbi:hypothetical protein BJV78DRAFT_763793 [Lactifluus subvellereus]|nr:hypothetical protein BJV78DRAFT_763793 [Lactifluus subvellereus]
MKFSVALAAVFLPVLVNAQYGPETETYPETSTTAGAAAAPSAPASSSTNINVDVAPGGKLVFNPSNFTAANGTTVTFFFPQSSISHSVTQSSFANPCTPLASGFDSGLQDAKQFSIKITNDQQPIWFFCKAPLHCGTGFVGSINAPTTGNTYDAYLAAAKAIGANEVTVPDSGPMTGGVGAVATAPPAATATTGSAKPTSSKSSAGHLVANGVVALLAAAFGITLA